MRVQSTLTTQTHAFELQHIWFDYKYTMAYIQTGPGTIFFFFFLTKRSGPKTFVFMLTT